MYMSGVHQCVQVTQQMTQQNVLQLSLTNKARNYHWSNGARLLFLAVFFFFNYQETEQSMIIYKSGSSHVDVW